MFVTLLPAVIMIRATQIFNINGEIGFRCQAIGYPSIRFVMWQTATGESVSETKSSGQQYFYETIRVSVLDDVDPLTCRQAGGYVCIYDNGRDNSTAITSQVLRCPVGEFPT